MISPQFKPKYETALQQLVSSPDFITALLMDDTEACSLLTGQVTDILQELTAVQGSFDDILGYIIDEVSWLQQEYANILVPEPSLAPDIPSNTTPKLATKTDPSREDSTEKWERPQINVGPGSDQASVIEQFHKALRHARQVRKERGKLFVHGERIVELVRESDGKTTVKTIPLNRLKYILMQDIISVKNDLNSGMVPIRLPEFIAPIIAQDPSGIYPKLNTLAMTPYFTESGQLISENGYDPESRIALEMPEGLKIPPVPDNVEKTDILRARQLIEGEILSDFPLDQSSKANCVALLLTIVFRQTIDGPKPLFLLHKKAPGAGASLMATSLCVAGTGSDPSITSQPRTDDEMRKRISAMVKSMIPLAVLDNLAHELNFESLAAVLTSTRWSDRLLGSSTLVDVAVNTVWAATANSPRLSAEIARRTVSIYLTVEDDRPEERVPQGGWRHPDLIKWIKSNRGDILWACLVLFKWWLQCGKPKPIRNKASFTDWADTVGGILHTAGIDGFLENDEALRIEIDEETDSWTRFLAVLEERFETRPFRVSEVLKCIPVAELGITPEHSKNTNQTLGYAIRKRLGRYFGGRQISRVGTVHGVATYKVSKRK